MKKIEHPITPGIRMLRDNHIEFEPHMYEYETSGGTWASSLALNIPEHIVIKTLVMETDQHKPLLVLMHGDCEVSTKQLARILGVKHIEPCGAAAAQRYTGYLFGGTSPFGTRSSLPVYAQRSIFELPSIYINGGKRGFLISIAPMALKILLPINEVDVAIAMM